MADLPEKRRRFLPEKRRLPKKQSRSFLGGLIATARFDFERFTHPLYLLEMKEAKNEKEEDKIMDRWMDMTDEEVEEKTRGQREKLKKTDGVEARKLLEMMDDSEGRNDN